MPRMALWAEFPPPPFFFRRPSAQSPYIFRGRQTHPKSGNTKEALHLHELFRKVRTNFCLFPCDTSQEPNRNCSEELVQMSFFILGGFFSGGFSSSEFFDAPTHPSRKFPGTCRAAPCTSFAQFSRAHGMFSKIRLGLGHSNSSEEQTYCSTNWRCATLGLRPRRPARGATERGEMAPKVLRDFDKRYSEAFRDF